MSNEHNHTEDDVSVKRLLKDSPKNWGKWGPDDEVGSLNYLTPEVILRAAGSIKQGKVFTLQVKMANPEGDPVWPGRSGAVRTMVMDEGHYIAGKGPDFPRLSMPIGTAALCFVLLASLIASIRRLDRVLPRYIAQLVLIAVILVSIVTVPRLAMR